MRPGRLRWAKLEYVRSGQVWLGLVWLFPFCKKSITVFFTAHLATCLSASICQRLTYFYQCIRDISSAVGTFLCYYCFPFFHGHTSLTSFFFYFQFLPASEKVLGTTLVQARGLFSVAIY